MTKSLSVALWLLVLHGPALAQLEMLMPKSQAAASAPTTGAAAKSLQQIEAELRPDPQCNRPQERFNITEKLMEYGGTEAGLRLQRLIDSDMKYDDISAADRQMLRYLAQTTVWLPVEVENKLGQLFDMGSSSQELEPVAALSLVTARTLSQEVRRQSEDFPGDIQLAHNAALADGAAAKFGGRIQLSGAMLQLMEQHPPGAEFVLAHEMAHVYKRHAVKQMQYMLLSSHEGWTVGRKLLQRAQRGANTNLIQDGIFAITTVPALIKMVQKMQLSYNQDQELEADTCAVRWLAAMGRQPWLAWQQYRQHFAQRDETMVAGSTHPDAQARENNLSRLVPLSEPATAAGRDKAKGDKARGDKKTPPKLPEKAPVKRPPIKAGAGQ